MPVGRPKKLSNISIVSPEGVVTPAVTNTPESVSVTPNLTDKEIKTEKPAPLPDTVSVNKNVYDELIARLDRLEASADKKNLNRYDLTHRDEMGEDTSLRVMGDKVVVGWSEMKRDIVEKNANGVWREDQMVELQYEDGTKETMEYVVFSRRYKLMKAHVLSKDKREIKKRNSMGEVIETTLEQTYRLRAENGREYLVRDTFLN